MPNKKESAEAARAVLAASRALVAVAARSLSSLDEEVTLPQFRALVLMGTKGPQSVSALAADLAIHASTATRLCDRLERKGLIERAVSAANRREVTVRLNEAGLTLLSEVTAVRAAEIERVLHNLPPEQVPSLVSAFLVFAAAAGEAPDTAWMLGW